MATWIASVYNASRALAIFKEFHKCKVKIEHIKLDIWFNNQCKARNVTPKYISVSSKHKSKSSNAAIRIARLAWLNAEIKDLHSRKQSLSENMYHLHLEIGKHDYDSKFD